MTINILIISDGRAGHYRQSEAIAMATSRIADTNIEWLQVRPRIQKLKRLYQILLGQNWLASVPLLKLAYHGLEVPRTHPDLIISAGGNTIPCNIALAQIYGCPNVFCGSIRTARPALFNVIYTPYSEFRDRPRHVFLPKPSPVDPSDLRPITPIANASGSTKVTGALLLGGATKQHPFKDQDWDQILRLISIDAFSSRIQWVITTSPRTPDEIADKFKEISADSQNVLEFVDFREAGSGSILPLLDKADFSICTEDSSSMVIESICAQRPTLSLYPASHRLNENEEKMLESMCEENYLARLLVQENLEENVSNALDQVEPMPKNHLEKLASTLAPLLDASAH